MSRLDCYESFQEGQYERLTRPLPSGAYKLRELQHRLIRSQRELRHIAAFVSRRASRWGFTACTPEDKYIWLRNLPSSVAYELGYDLVPGFNALTADGVPPTQVLRRASFLEESANTLVADLECARLRIARRVAAEYENMRSGRPMLESLVARAIDLADLGLGLLPEHSNS